MFVNTLLTLVGPTAVGKTETSLLLARALNAEIISADSRQVYRGMDIGTAKIQPHEMAGVPHHLLDIRQPHETMTLGEYKVLAETAIQSIMARQRLPMLVGGTGQYVRAVIEGWQIPKVPPQPQLRARLQALANDGGKEAVFEQLKRLDPASAESIDYRNLRRVIRAIEVSTVAGRPFSELQTKRPPSWRIVQMGLTRPRAALYARADARIDAMFAAGWPEEVQALLARGYTPELSSFGSLGYREVAAYLAGEYDQEEAKTRIRRATRNFIRRQYNWFRLSNPAIHWFDLEETHPRQILDWLSQYLKDVSD
jgi:tRNA dimethylallyltransferase